MINATTGWNTWNYEALAALSYVDIDRTLLELRVTVIDDLTGEHIRDLGWRDVAHLGPHAFDGSYVALEFRAGFEAQFKLEAAATGSTLALCVTPTRTSSKRVVLDMRVPGGPHGAAREGNTWHLPGWGVRVWGATPEGSVYARTSGPNAVGNRGEALAAIAWADKPASLVQDEPWAAVSAAAARHAREATGSDGDLGDGVQAMLRAAAWNTVYDLSGRGVCITASRDWCRDWRSVVLFGWDTFFHGLIAGVESPEAAWNCYGAALAGAAPEGFVPNWRLSHGVYTRDRSQPPVGAMCVWATYLRHSDPAALERLYPGLRRWHGWWRTARETPEGLLAWGSDPAAAWAFPELRQATHGEHICCCYESGMDNSPMFDSVPYDRHSGQMAQADVGLTCLYTVDAECLANIASVLGRTEDAAAFAAEADSFRARIRTLLWCEQERLFLNRLRTGELNRRRSPTSFYPLLCGAATPAQAECLVRDHLLSENAFWGEYPLPSIARTDPAFRDNDYWRGRIWAPMVYLVTQGLRRYGYDGTAHDLAWRAHRLLLRGWRDNGAVYENYNAVTGEGGDVPNADPLYVWGGLLALVAVEEMARPTPQGIAFGSPFAVTASVTNLTIGGRRHDVRQSSHGLEVDRDGEPLLREATPRRITVA